MDDASMMSCLRFPTILILQYFLDANQKLLVALPRVRTYNIDFNFIFSMTLENDVHILGTEIKA